MRRVHPNFNLTDESADDRPSCFVLVGFHWTDARRAILSFQLKSQNVDSCREMLQGRLWIVIAQLSEI